MKSFKRSVIKPYKVICGALVMGLFLGACNEDKLLNPVPETSLLAKDAFATPSRILGQVNGIYANLKVANFLGGRYQFFNDVRGEEFLNRLNNVFTGYEAWNHTVNSGSADASTCWIAGYAAINSANLFIDGMAANPGVVSDELSKQYLAEAKFARALTYFNLVTMYGQPYVKDNGASLAIPLRIVGESSTANNNMPRSTVAQVYAQILKDLDEAEADLPANYATADLNTTRAHRNTAIALKSRVYLSMGKFDKVVEEAAKIVSAAVPFKAPSGVAHQLQPNIQSIFNSNYTTTESIFSMPMTALNYVSGQSSLVYLYTLNQEYAVNPEGIYGDPLWPSTDARKTLFRTSGTTTYLTKFASAAFLDYIPVIRYSEVLLNYAEAAAKTGDLAKAQELLDAVRHRSDATYEFDEADVNSTTAIVNTILKERRIELMGEGFRSNDLLRNLLTIPSKGTAPAISPSQPEYIFPIPNAEISANQDL